MWTKYIEGWGAFHVQQNSMANLAGDVAETMGLFVVFEGGDGSGKSTQSRGLKRRLAKAGCPTVLVHEPGGTPLENVFAAGLKAARKSPTWPRRCCFRPPEPRW